MLQVCQYITYEVPYSWDTGPTRISGDSLSAATAMGESQEGVCGHSEAAVREKSCASLRQSHTAASAGSRPMKKMERVRLKIGMHSGPVIRYEILPRHSLT